MMFTTIASTFAVLALTSQAQLFNVQQKQPAGQKQQPTTVDFKPNSRRPTKKKRPSSSSSWECKHNYDYRGSQSDQGYTDEYCQYKYCLNGSADPTKYPAQGCYYEGFTSSKEKDYKQCICDDNGHDHPHPHPDHNMTKYDFKAPQKLFHTDNYDNEITKNTMFMTKNAHVSNPGGALNVQVGNYDGPAALVANKMGNWPAIDGMKFSIASFIVDYCSMVSPHVHSDAHEFNTVIQGEGIIGSFGVNDGKWHFNKVTVGDSFVFPMGSVHLWLNTGKEQLATVGGFTASMPTAALMGMAFADLDMLPKSGLTTELFPKLEENECYKAIEELSKMVEN